MIAIGKHMVAQPTNDGWLVGTKRQSQLLGWVKWHTKWHQFEFVPAVGTAYTHDCLTALGQFLTEQNAKRKGSSR